MSKCGKGNDYQVEMNEKVKTFQANMLKKNIERADQDGAEVLGHHNKIRTITRQCIVMFVPGSYEEMKI